jgi:hypothetical protein
MGDRWPPLHEFIGLAVGTLIIISLAVAVIVLAQSLGCRWQPSNCYNRRKFAYHRRRHRQGVDLGDDPKALKAGLRARQMLSVGPLLPLPRRSAARKRAGAITLIAIPAAPSLPRRAVGYLICAGVPTFLGTRSPCGVFGRCVSPLTPHVQTFSRRSSRRLLLHSKLAVNDLFSSARTIDLCGVRLSPCEPFA